MSRERAVLVRLRRGENGVESLLADIRGAWARAKKALPGERIDVIRYEALSTQLERRARQEHTAGRAGSLEISCLDRDSHCFFDDQSADLLPSGAEEARSWITAGDIAVELRLPLAPGATPTPTAQGIVKAPAKPWQAPVDARGRQLTGTSAVAERFRQQLRAAVDQVPDSAMRPSGVSNRVLTETLREFVGDKESASCDVEVQYRDGSCGPRFPMCCLDLADDLPRGCRVYRFAMLSIRHTEMDVEVDGAWLRNTVISRPRPAGDTDAIVFDLTRQQFDKLCAQEPVVIYLYQTGLDSAVVGFYRAVTERLMASPGSLSVVPMYFRRQPPTLDRVAVAGYQPQSTFEEGRPWAV